MKTYYKLVINKTARPMGKQKNPEWERYSCYDNQESVHDTIAEAMASLKEQLWSENCKREKVYQDGKDGEAIHIGYVYCFNSPAYSYDDVKHHEKWWVSIYKINSTPVKPSEWK